MCWFMFLCVCVDVYVYYMCIYVCVCMCMCVYLFVLVCDRPEQAPVVRLGAAAGGHTSQTSGGGPQQLAKLGCGAQICFGISDERNNRHEPKLVVIGPNK